MVKDKLNWSPLLVRIPLFVLFFLSSTHQTRAQQPVSIHYNSSAGLISNETYDILCDSKGYTWIATELGVSRYNGYEFENFDVNDGLPDQVILNLQEDREGRIWFTSFSGATAYYDEGKITPYPYNSIILERTTKKYPPLIFSSGGDSLFVNLYGVGRFLINPSGKVVEGLPKIENPEAYKQMFTVDLHYDKIHETLIRIGENDLNDSVLITWQGKNYFAPTLRSPYVMLTADYGPNKSLYISFNDWLAEIDSSGRSKSFQMSFNMTKSKRLVNGQHVVGTVNHGLFIYDELNEVQFKYHLLDGKRITGLAEDKLGGIWASTLNNGIYYIPNNGLLVYLDKKEERKVKISAIERYEQGLILGYENGAIKLLNPNSSNWAKIKDSDGERVYDLELFNDQIYAVNNDQVRALSFNGKITQEVKAVGKCAVNSGDSVLYVGGLQLIKFTKDKYDIRKAEGRIEFMAPYQDGKFYTGNGWGLWELNIQDQPISSSKTPISTPISGLVQHGELLIVCTKGEGILIIHGGNHKRLNTENYLSSNNIRAVEIYQDQIWVVHEQGIDVIKLDATTLDVHKQFTLEKRRDLPATNVTSIVIDDERVWLGTEDDLYSISHNYKSESSNYPPPIIKHTKLNDSLVMNGGEYSSDLNNLSGEFLSLDFQSQGEQTYRYRLQGLDTNWQTTKSRSINYAGLPAGQYALEVQSQQGLYGWSKSAIGPTFIIETPLIERTWFIWMILILFTSLVYGLILITYVARNRRKARNVQTKVNLMDLKLKALQAQMNPHFTFNTLNSIQYYILENDAIKAAEYLTKFSTLIRKFLDHSRANFISVHEELNTIKAYLDLENIRLNDQIEYTIEVDDNINTLNIEIPAAVMQPFVENAIWHGIAPKKTQGHISIRLISLPNGGLKCVIEDDGVGRSHKKQSTKPKHKSLGTRISQERIDLLTELYEQEFSIEIEDLFHNDGNPAGTRVVIIFFKTGE